MRCPQEKRPTWMNFEAATEYLLNEIKPNDVLIVFSAGDATQVSQSVYQQLAAKEIG